MGTDHTIHAIWSEMAYMSSTFFFQIPVISTMKNNPINSQKDRKIAQFPNISDSGK